MRRHHFALLHRYLGLALGVLLFIAGLGGAVVAFQQELDRALNPAFYLARNVGPTLSASVLASHIEAADARAELTYLQLAPSAGATAQAYVEPRREGDELGYDQVAVEPSTGQIQGRRQWGACCFERQNLIPFIYRLHYSLGLPDAWGQWVMGCTAIAWLIDCFVGLYLTFPRKGPFWPKWRNRWSIRVSAGVHRAVYDAHNAAGLWPWVLLLLLALSSIDMNLDAEVFRPMVSYFGPLSSLEEQRASPGSSRSLSWDQAIAVAYAEAARRGWPTQAQWASWRRSENAYHIGFDVREPDVPDTGARHEFRVQADTGDIVTIRDPAGRTSGDFIVDLQYPIHTGRLLGVGGRILICLAGLVTAGLSVTGIWLWFRRQRNGRRRVNAPAHCVPAPKS